MLTIFGCRSSNGLRRQKTKEHATELLISFVVIPSMRCARSAQPKRFSSGFLEKYIHAETRRVHSRFRQSGETGRTSSTDPNVQNIPWVLTGAAAWVMILQRGHDTFKKTRKCYPDRRDWCGYVARHDKCSCNGHKVLRAESSP